MMPIAPRAFIPNPTAAAWRHFMPPMRAPSAQARVERLEKIHPQADRREKDRGEDVDDEVLDDHSRALFDARGADGEAHDEASEDGVQPDGVRRGGAEEREENHERQHPPGARGGRSGALEPGDDGLDESPTDK